MAYLSLPGGLTNFSKGVISLWFRIPSASLAVAAAQTADEPLKGIVPLIIFGDPTVTGTEVSSGFSPTGTYTREEWYYVNNVVNPHFGEYWLKPGTDSTVNINDSFYNAGASVAKPSCFVGVDTQQGEVDNVLRFRVQMSGAVGTGAGMGYASTGSVSGDNIVYAGPNNSPGTGPFRSGSTPSSFGPDAYGGTANIVPDFNPWEATTAYTDRSSIQFGATTEYFDVALKTAVVSDRWHHILISFDITGSIAASGRLDDITDRFGATIVAGGPDKGTITSDCRVWIAYDDVNKSGTALDYGIDFDDVNSIGANDFVTQNSVDTASASGPQNQALGPLAQSGYARDITVTGASLPSYGYTPASITSASHPVALPAATTAHIQVVEMAELHFYTGVTLDTSNSTNRRAFVTSDGRPETDFTIADALLGKSPEIRLHTRAKWKAGTNDGTAGDLSKTGTINDFDPGPSLS